MYSSNLEEKEKIRDLARGFKWAMSNRNKKPQGTFAWLQWNRHALITSSRVPASWFSYYRDLISDFVPGASNLTLET